jgi:Helix-hairpin-helix domain
MIRGIGPVYAKKLLRAFGDKVFDVIEAEPDRLREVDGIVGGLERARGSFRALARSVSPIPARPFLLLPAGTP